MIDIINSIKNNQIFNNINEEDIKNLILSTRFTQKKYTKDSIIANEGEFCSSIGLVISGAIELQRIYQNGKYVVLKRLITSDVFGEALIFVNNGEYPATVVSLEDSRILFINKEDILKMCLQNTKLLENFMALLSGKIMTLNDKIKSISYNTIREKVVNYLLSECEYGVKLEIKLKESKEEIANFLGIPRPSFSRELMKLRDEGLIEYNRDKIKIIDALALEEVFFE